MLPGLEDKKLVLGVCGGIAAYKSAFLVRLLVKARAQVKVAMTPAATQFISSLTLATLSKNEVRMRFYDKSSGKWHSHVDLGLWADAFVIAPATANTIAKLANGLCDNYLASVYLSARCPVFVAPAMDLDMWKHPATQANVAKLAAYGNHILPVGCGELASGLSGEGRMAEPEQIAEALANHFNRPEASGLPLKGKNVLVTAGPTYEPIDPVRFIGNRSSGKMGIALAEEACRLGAEVTLVLGPTHLRPQTPQIKVVEVGTAAQMYQAAMSYFPQCHIAIAAAAVADYTPAKVAERKIKKQEGGLSLELERTEDILAGMGKAKSQSQVLVGFALETDNELENAKGKLERKNADLIVLNSLNNSGAGFRHDTNKVSILGRHNKIKHFGLKPKTQVAADIWQEVLGLPALKA